MLRWSLLIACLVVATQPDTVGAQAEESERWFTLVREGAAQLEAGRNDEAVATLEQALALTASLPDANQRFLDTVEWLALADLNLGRYDDAEKLYLSELELLTDRPSKRQLLPLRQLARLAMMRQDHEAVQGYCTRYRSLSEELLDDDPDLAPFLTELAQLAYEQRRYERAEELFRDVVSLTEARQGEQSLELVQGLENLAQVKLARGEGDAAGELLQRSLALQERALGVDSPRLVPTLGVLADYLWAEARVDEAETLWQRIVALEEAAGRPTSDAMIQALEKMVRRFGLNHPPPSLIDLELFNKLLEEHEAWSSFAALCRRLLQVKEQRFGADDYRLMGTLTQLTWIAVAQADYEQAAEYQRRAVAIAAATFGPNGKETVTQLNNLGAVHYAGEDYDVAFLQFSQALEAQQAGGSPEDEGMRTVLINCIAAAEKSHQRKQARQLRRQLRELELKTHE